MLLILTLAAVVGIAVLPVMLAARMMDAERQSFLASLIAVILQFVLMAVIQATLTEGMIAFAVALVVGSAIYAYVLGTSVLKGFAISILATVIALVAALMFGASFALLGSAT